MALPFFEIEAGEVYAVGFDYTGSSKLPSGATLSSATVSALDKSTNTTDNSILASTTATVSGLQVRVNILPVTADKEYKITFVVTLNNGNVLKPKLWFRVTNN